MEGPLKAKKNELVLYFAHGSIYSERARLALVEKNLTFTECIVDLGKWEHLQPWFLEHNPEGTIPMLQHGDKFIPDSLAIIKYLDLTFGAPLLQPATHTEYGRRVQEITKKLERIDIGCLTMGSMRNPELIIDPEISAFKMKEFLDSKDKVLEVLPMLKEQHPEMGELYDKKTETVTTSIDKTHDKSQVEAEIERTHAILKEAETLLEKTQSGNFRNETWLFGEDFTVADIMLAATLKRLNWIGLSKVLFKDGKLPLVEDYLDRLSYRESFQQVCLSLNPNQPFQPKLPELCRSPMFKTFLVGVAGAFGAVIYYFFKN